MPRNLGPYNPPPLSERIQASVAGLGFLGCIIGSQVVTNQQDLVSLAIASALFLITALMFPAKAMDKYGVGEDDQTRGKPPQ